MNSTNYDVDYKKMCRSSCVHVSERGPACQNILAFSLVDWYSTLIPLTKSVGFGRYMRGGLTTCWQSKTGLYVFTHVASALERWSLGSGPFKASMMSFVFWQFVTAFKSIPSFYRPILYIEWMILLQNWTRLIPNPHLLIVSQDLYFNSHISTQHTYSAARGNLLSSATCPGWWVVFNVTS